MLPKKNRLDKKIVENIFKNGSFVNSSNLTLKFISNKNTTPPRFSFITPKTASKKAVVRNLLRRRGYTVLKKYFKNFHNGFVGAFVFGKESVEVFGGRKNKTYNPILNLENEIKNILSKIH